MLEFEVIPEKCFVRVPVTDDQIRAAMLFSNPICHPSAMWRSELTIKHQLLYNERYLSAQDEDLWFRLSNYGKLYNIPQVLLKYRIHENQISSQKSNLQIHTAINIRTEKIRTFFVGNPPLDIPFYQKLISPSPQNFSLYEISKLVSVIKLIAKHNRNTKKYIPVLLHIQLANLMIRFTQGVQDKINLKFYLRILFLFIYIRRVPYRFLIKLFFFFFKKKLIKNICIYFSISIGDHTLL